MRGRVGAVLVLVLAGVTPAAVAAAGEVTPMCGGLEATIVGTTEADVLKGTGAIDVIVGLAGNDVIDGRGGDDVICGGAGADQLRGGPGDDRLYGGTDGKGADRAGVFLVGDVLRGGTGDDLLDLGTDDRRGHKPPDTVAYDESSTPVVVDLAAGTATGEGTDTIVVATQTALVGSAYDDTLAGGASGDRIAGGHGNDLVDGRDGDDQLTGDDSLGVDWMVGTPVPLAEAETDDDVVTGGAGNDFLLSAVGRDSLAGNGEDDQLLSTSPDPTTLDGGTGADGVEQWLATSSGSAVDGGPGLDVLSVWGTPFETATPKPTYTIDLRSGSTSVGSTEPVTGTIAGFEEHRLYGRLPWAFYGTTGPDRVWALNGGPLKARLYDGDDWVIGSSKPDRLYGGPGTDKVSGREGGDTCVDFERGTWSC